PAKAPRLKKRGPTSSRRSLFSSKRPPRPKSSGAFVTRCSSPRLRCLLGKVRVLSDSEICRILEQNGFAEVRQRGSHRVHAKALGDNHDNRSGATSRSHSSRHAI